MVYAATYLAFAVATESWHAWTLFIVYGAYCGLTEPAEKALVKDLVHALGKADQPTTFGDIQRSRELLANVSDRVVLTQAVSSSAPFSDCSTHELRELKHGDWK